MADAEVTNGESPVTLRAAESGDRQQILEVHTSAIRELSAGHYSAEQLEAWAGRFSVNSYDRIIAERTFLVAVDGNTILGFGQLDPTTGEIEAIYVRPAAARRGVGSALLGALEACARNAGLPELFIDASINAAPFYAHGGFCSVEQRVHRFESGVGITCVRMTKALTQG